MKGAFMFHCHHGKAGAQWRRTWVVRKNTMSLVLSISSKRFSGTRGCIWPFCAMDPGKWLRVKADDAELDEPMVWFACEGKGHDTMLQHLWYMIQCYSTSSSTTASWWNKFWARPSSAWTLERFSQTRQHWAKWTNRPLCMSICGCCARWDQWISSYPHFTSVHTSRSADILPVYPVSSWNI